MSVPGYTRSAAAPESSQTEVAVRQNEIKKMQDSLRNKGHYRGKVDGIIGLRTRASIRAYQKAESLPITGLVDTRTADGLGCGPESEWDDSTSAGPEARHRDKPSAGIGRVEGSANKTRRRNVSTTITIQANRGDGVSKQQAENEPHE
jgi:peptidoglycan hydrolase-like protein with peptidoglycan-binding domain